MGNLKYVKSKGFSADGETLEVVEYEYNSIGQRTGVINPNGTTVSYTYDVRGNVDTITHKDDQEAVLLELDYTRDKRGIITQVVESRDGEQYDTTWIYEYDAQNRLTTATKTVDQTDAVYTYTYDNASNRTSKSITGAGTTTYTYNDLDQLVSDGSKTYLYDHYGNLQYEKDGAGKNLRRYYWSTRNELTKAELFDANEDVEHTVVFGYDDKHTRISRQYDVDEPIKYLTDYNNTTGSSQVLAELDESATEVQKSYIYGSNLLSQVNASSSEVAFYHGDHLGSTRLLTDTNGSAVANSAFNYSPYGEVLEGANASTDYYFTGQYYDSTLALQYHRARWLNCLSSSWLSIDGAFDFPTNFGNLYAYAGLNPIQNFDAIGTFAMSECIAVTDIIGGLTALDISFGVGILNSHGGESAQMAGLILQLIKHVGVLGLCFIPVIGFFVSAIQSPQTMATIIGSIKIIGEEIGKRNIMKAVVIFGLILLCVLELSAVAFGAFHLVKGIKVFYKQSLSTISSKIAKGSNWKFGELSNPIHYESYGVCRRNTKKINEMTGRSFRKSNYVEAHHLLEKRFADKVGINESEIISVPLTAKYHGNVGGEGININKMIEDEFLKIGADIGNATPAQIWQAHKNVYIGIDKEEWAEAIYRAYFTDIGVRY